MDRRLTNGWASLKGARQGGAAHRLARGVVIAEAAIVVLVLAFIVVGVPLYVFPATDEPTKADAVFVLGPPSQPRLDYAQKLMDQGLAKTLVVSIKPQRTAADKVGACDADLDYTVECFVADPNTTQGEAQQLRQLSEEHGWNTVIVVTFRSHITRARVIMERCYSGKLEMVAAPKTYHPAEWVREYLYQTAAFLKVAVSTSC